MTAKPYRRKLQRSRRASFFSTTATLTFTRCELFMPSLTGTPHVVGSLGWGKRVLPIARAESRLVGVSENFRHADRQKDRYGHDSERDQKHTGYELDRFVGLLLFLLRFIHMPINAHPIPNGAPSHGGSAASR